MVFFALSATAQRGTCTSGATNAYTIIDGTTKDDKTDAVSSPVYTVAKGAIVKVGISPTYLDWGQTVDFSILVSVNGVFQYAITKATVATYGDKWQPTLTGGLFANADDVITAEMTITPIADGTNKEGCTEPWTYTYNYKVASGCINPNPIPYYKDPIKSWTNKLTTDYTIPVNLKAGVSLIVGINPASGTIEWSDTKGFTGNTQEFTYNPQLVNPGDSTTLTGIYTDVCGKATTYNYVFSIPLVCTPVPQSITAAYYQVGTGTWYDAVVTAPVGEVHVTGGSTITFGPWPTDGKYKYSWTGSGASQLDSTTKREPIFNDVTGESCQLTATITYDDGCNPAATASYTFTVIVDDKPLAVSKFDQKGFKMYPNPASSRLNVDFNGDLNVSVLNSRGQQVLAPRAISKQGSVDVSALSTGIYFLKAVSNGDSTVKKFIKK